MYPVNRISFGEFYLRGKGDEETKNKILPAVTGRIRV